jgi:hypothetical protein
MDRLLLVTHQLAHVTVVDLNDINTVAGNRSRAP